MRHDTGYRREIHYMKYICDLCGWEYDEEEGYPEGGIEPETSWDDISDEFECPLCGAGKEKFTETEE